MDVYIIYIEVGNVYREIVGVYSTIQKANAALAIIEIERKGSEKWESWILEKEVDPNG